MVVYISVEVDNNQYKIIRPVAFLSRTIEKKWEASETGDVVQLESISPRTFEKFVEFGDVYAGIDEKTQRLFMKNIAKYMVNGSSTCEQIEWIIEMIEDLSSEELFSLMSLAETIEADFMITILGYKLSELLGSSRENIKKIIKQRSSEQ